MTKQEALQNLIELGIFYEVDEYAGFYQIFDTNFRYCENFPLLRSIWYKRYLEGFLEVIRYKSSNLQEIFHDLSTEQKLKILFHMHLIEILDGK